MPKGVVGMTKRELAQAGVLERVVAGRYTQAAAAAQLGISERHVRRQLARYRKHGAAGLAHGLRGRPGNRRGDGVLTGCALSLVAEHYPDFGPTLAAEKLLERQTLTIPVETLRQAMIAAGQWQPGKRRVRHRAWRERKRHRGELVQLDGSDHRWFEGRAAPRTLLAFIDDATSEVLGLRFALSESTESVLRASQDYFGHEGVPARLYVDQGGVFKVNLNNPDDRRITQYRRAVEELGITLTYARSPQAKGRVERLFGTLQDRLVKELRLAGISSIAEANRFLVTYQRRHNARFAVAPAAAGNLHRSVSAENLTAALCWREERVVTNDFTIRYHNRWLQLAERQRTILRPGARIMVSRALDGTLSLSIRNVTLVFTEIAKPIRSPKPGQLRLRQAWKPAPDHPWRTQPINA